MSLIWRKRVFFLLLPLLVAAAVLGTRFRVDLSSFILAGDNLEQGLLATEMQSGSFSRRYVLSITGVAEKPLPRDFVERFISELQTVDGVTDVWKPEQGQVEIDAIVGFYTHHASRIYSLQPEKDAAQMFAAEALHQRAHRLRELLLSPQSSRVKRIALADPLLLTVDAFSGFGERMQSSRSDHRGYQNLLLETRVSGMDAEQQERIAASIRDRFDALNRDVGDTLRLQMTGVPVYAMATRRLIRGDIVLVSILSTLALGGLFLGLFRSFRVLMSVACLLAAVIATAIVITNSVFGSIHGMTIAIGTTLIGICIDYPIHALVHGAGSAGSGREAVIARIFPSMLLGGITTATGYSALGFSGYPGFQQISVYASVGIVTALLLTRYVLPALTGEQAGREVKIPGVAAWVRCCDRFRRPLLGLVAVALVLSVYGIFSLHWIDDLQQLTPELDSIKENDRMIRSRMVSIEPGRFVLVSGENTQQTLRRAEQVYPVLNELRRDGKLEAYYGLYPWLVSQQLQRRNQLMLKNLITAETLDHWNNALASTGLSVERLGRLDYPAGSTLDPEQVRATPAGRLVGDQIVETGSGTLAMIWIAGHDPDSMRAALSALDGVQYFSQRDLLNRIMIEYRDRALAMLLVGLAVIVGFLLLRYRSPGQTLQTLGPALLSATLILGIWSLTGQPLSFLHLVGFVLAVAICVDYGIFYSENRAGDQALTYHAIAASMLTSALAFGSLASADTSSLRVLAAMVSLGVILGFLLCPLLIRTGTGDGPVSGP